MSGMTNPSGKIDFGHSGIGSVLKQRRLVVPLNQREYSWEERHVSVLFDDFAGAIADNKGTYFLGTIVLTKDEQGRPEVTDGQQRLATTTILIAAIRDHFFRNGDEKRALSLQPYLMEIDTHTAALVPKLRLNVDDHEFFTKFICPNPDDPQRKIQPDKDKESHSLIVQAAKLAATRVRTIVEGYATQTQTSRLLEWVDFIETGAEVITLDVPDELDAFVMFETLNDRGLKASQADLIKNYLFSQARTHEPSRIVEAQSKWSSMNGALQSVGQDEVTVTYLHHIFITKYGATKEREDLAKVRAWANSPARAMEVLHELAESASDYAALFNADHSKWNDYGTSMRHHISTIHRDLPIEQIRPLMLAVARHFGAKQAKEAFRRFVFWSERFLISGGRGGLLDRWYSLSAQQVAEGKIKTANALTDYLAEIIPPDGLFEDDFARARVSQTHLARYYLRALEKTRKGQPEPEFTPNDDENVINLEHVLPQNPGTSWPNIDAEMARTYWRRIGNMAILQAKHNSVIGNASFAEKKPMLAASAFLTTQDIAQYKTWGAEEIQKRQRELATLAVKTWPIK
jgi:hypothetical protein